MRQVVLSINDIDAAMVARQKTEITVMKSIGIDYHKRYSLISIIDEEGVEVHLERIEHAFPERFERLLSEHVPCQIGFEATMNWGWLYDLLETIPGVERIVMANPLHGQGGGSEGEGHKGGGSANES